MTDRTQMMFDILLGIQNDLGLIKREQSSQGLRLSSIEDHIRGATPNGDANLCTSPSAGTR